MLITKENVAMRNKFLLKLFILILVAIIPFIFWGCGTMSNGQREKRLKELLRNKYGEDFEIRELYVTGKVDAWCYPVNDPTMIIKVDTTLNMDEIGMDNYIQSIICRQIDNELTPSFQQVFKGCYLSSHNFYGNTNDYYDYYNSINMKSFAQYVQKKGSKDCYTISVFIDIDSISSNNVLFEYEEINKIIGELQKKGDNTSVFVDLYFCDNKRIIEAQNAISNYSWKDSENSETDIYDVIQKIPEIEIYFGRDADSYLWVNGEKIELSYQVYKKEREAVINE